MLVFVVGGAFERGSSSSSAYGPEFLLDEDIVLITLNYRLGILGEFKRIMVSFEKLVVTVN